LPRPLVIGNGRMLVNLDARLALRDLYYPHVGQVNHIAGRRHLVGVWAGGRFSWIDEDGWGRRLAYRRETLVTHAVATHPALGLTLEIDDAVHYRWDILVRRVRVLGGDGPRREVRLFFTNDVNIDESDVGDTAVYDPETGAIVHYKRDIAFLFCGRVDGRGIHQYSCGRKRFAGAEGTWRDAEDGRLEGNPVSHGAVDSTFSLSGEVGAGAGLDYYYWLVAGRSVAEVRAGHTRVLERGPERLLDETETYWRAWVNREGRSFGDLPQRVVDLWKRSLLVVRTQIDATGAIVAANDSDILTANRDHYCYVWPRDGALVARAVDLAGYSGVTRPFFRFCERALAEGGYMRQKYNPDGTIGSTWHPWLTPPLGPSAAAPGGAATAGGTASGAAPPKCGLPIQEDETALVLCALDTHYTCHRDLEFIAALYPRLIRPSAEFMLYYRDPQGGLPLPSYDLWEERWGVFTFTASAVAAALKAAARFGRLLGDEGLAAPCATAAAEMTERIGERLYAPALGRFLRGLYTGRDGCVSADPTIESSTCATWLLGVFDPADDRVRSTMRALREGLWVNTDVGGIARYQGDGYFRKSDDLQRVPGNPWVICTLWLAAYYAALARTRADLKASRAILEWAADRAMETGVLPEQLHPYTGEPVSVAPLTWAQATFVEAVLRYVDRYNLLPGATGEPHPEGKTAPEAEVQ